MRIVLIVFAIFSVFVLNGCSSSADSIKSVTVTEIEAVENSDKQENSDSVADENKPESNIENDEKQDINKIKIIREKFSQLYSNFENEKYNYSNPTNAFYSSDFYNQLKSFICSKESVDIPDWELRSITGQDDMKSVSGNMVYNGTEYNVRFISYGADFYVQSLTDSAMMNKSLFYQVWNDDEFYSGTVFERGQDYIEGLGMFEYDEDVFAVLWGMAAGYPMGSFLSGFRWNGSEFVECPLFYLENSDNVFIAGENNNLSWYNEYTNGKFMVFGGKERIEVSFCEDGSRDFGGIFSVNVDFSNKNEITLSANGINGDVYKTELEFSEGIFRN